MSKGFYIITGTSRGIGESLAMMLLEKEHHVFGISRGMSDILSRYKNYSHYNYDLSDTANIGQLLKGILEQLKIEETVMICLINNAAMLEPLKSIENCEPEEISKSLDINLIAPIVMSSCFIKLTDHLKVRRKIVNITSGAGVHPLEDMSMYCTAKAGLNMFTRCVGVEQAGNENPIEIIAVDPGMVETEMQKTARGKSSDAFAMANFFKEAFTNGDLQSPEALAVDLDRIIANEYETGKLINHDNR